VQVGKIIEVLDPGLYSRVGEIDGFIAKRSAAVSSRRS
jgi:hypothetical protein